MNEKKRSLSKSSFLFANGRQSHFSQCFVLGKTLYESSKQRAKFKPFVHKLDQISNFLRPQTDLIDQDLMSKQFNSLQKQDRDQKIFINLKGFYWQFAVLFSNLSKLNASVFAYNYHKAFQQAFVVSIFLFASDKYS